MIIHFLKAGVWVKRAVAGLFQQVMNHVRADVPPVSVAPGFRVLWQM